MGLKHRSSAGTACQDIQPLYDSFRIPSDVVRQQLQSLSPAEASEAEAAACSDFKAAALSRRISSQTGKYDVHGIASAICGHEHVLGWCDLLGPETFSCYDVLVERCCAVVGDRGIAVFFVDIACRYQAWF